MSRSSRSALLIGVPEYRDSNHNLPFIRDDIGELDDAFRGAGYRVVSPLLTDPDRYKLGDILEDLSNFTSEVREETTVVYLSGHGIHYEGTDYLIPGDALVNPSDPSRLFLSVDEVVGAFENTSGLRNLIVFIDACREGLELNTMSTQYLREWSRGKVRELSQRNVACIYGCRSGKYSYHNSEYSFLSKALATVIQEGTAATYDEVVQALQDEVHALAEANRQEKQKLRIRTETPVSDAPLAGVVLFPRDEDAAPEVEDDNPWSQAVRSSRLWPVPTEGDEPDDAFRDHAVRIVASCWTAWTTSRDGLPDDPWSDERFPLRVVNRLEFLVTRRCNDLDLTSAEAALLLTAPFVREAALAAATRAVVDAADPFAAPDEEASTGVCTSSSSIELRGELETTFDKNRPHLRRAKRLWETGDEEGYRTVAAWLVHQCVRRLPTLFTPASDDGLFPDDLFDRCPPPDDRDDVAEGLAPDRLRTFARWVLSDISRLTQTDTEDALETELVLSPGTVHQTKTRDKVVASLLALAGQMALEGRLLSDVIIDHVGLSRPIDPSTMLPTLDRLRWYPEAPALVLDGACSHPAIDLALREHVEAADVLLKDLTGLVHGKQFKLDALKGIPQRLSDHRLCAEEVDGSPAYETPHLRFRLDQNEVQELLMGKQLYGDPSLAIREMYQNALDACRYRQARTRYLEVTQDGFTSDWDGQITFRQDVTDDGREYIECEDNGIGMGRRELSDAFAKAGRRYHDLPEFIEERAEWQRHDVELYPNSQFGIGVFSYFMLADELEIETTRMSRDDEGTEETLLVDVTGSGSLFRVRTAPEKCPTSGTRIRLYLRPGIRKELYSDDFPEGLEEPLSCVHVLRRLLCVADYRTDANHGEEAHSWTPGEVDQQCLAQFQNQSRKVSRLPQVVKVHDTLWWSEDITGRWSYKRPGSYFPHPILSDGIITDKRNYGAVINLTGRHKPELSVDRKRIIKCENKYLDSLRASSIKPLAQDTPEWVKMEWLWNLGVAHPSAAEQFAQAATSTEKELPVDELMSKKSYSVKSGLLPMDSILLVSGRDILHNKVGDGLFLKEKSILEKVAGSRVRLYLDLEAGEARGVKTCSQQLDYRPSDEILIGGPIGYRGQVENFKAKVIAASHLSGLSLSQALGRLEEIARTTKYQLEYVVPDKHELDGLTATDLDMNILGLGPGEEYVENIDLGILLYAFSEIKESPRVLYDRLKTVFEAVGFSVPEVNVDAILALSGPDRSFLLKSLDGEPPLYNSSSAYWRKGTPTTELLSEVYRIVDKIGASIPKIDLSSEHLQDLSPSDWRELNRTLSMLPGEGGRVTPICLAYILSQLEVGLEKANNILSAILKKSKISLSDNCVGALKNKKVKEVDFSLFTNGSRAADSRPPFVDEVIPGHILRLIDKTKMSPSEVYRRLESYRERLHIDIVNCNISRFEIDSLEEAYMLRRVLGSSRSGFVEEITSERIVILSWFLQTHVADILDRLRPFEALGYVLPELDEDGMI